MQNRTIVAISMIAAILMTVSAAELAFARGGGGKGGGNCIGSGPGRNAGAGMSQGGKMQQQQDQQEYRYRHRQDNGVTALQTGSGQATGNQARLRERKQLRDPATHPVAPTE
jgi:hypothetical protein